MGPVRKSRVELWLQLVEEGRILRVERRLRVVGLGVVRLAGMVEHIGMEGLVEAAQPLVPAQHPEERRGARSEDALKEEHVAVEDKGTDDAVQSMDTSPNAVLSRYHRDKRFNVRTLLHKILGIRAAYAISRTRRS
ncbi:MAG: hypothetical protein BRD43_00755 [Bacteroidetes bacterium QS_4_64_154]|nr:MAG: hypothetical protein BRD43_00755 [Bacteroidetes bacterium QS_4_64_154]